MTATTARPFLLDRLAAVFPFIAITADTMPDSDPYKGDAPAFAYAGLECHAIQLTATAIAHGRMIDASAGLGSCWMAEPGEAAALAHLDGSGYLPQYLDEVIRKLASKLIEAGMPLDLDEVIAGLAILYP